MQPNQTLSSGDFNGLKQAVSFPANYAYNPE
jgi:hypothetical protein